MSVAVRFEVVAGLAPKIVTPPGELRPRQLSCIGDREDIDAKSGFHLAPNVPQTLPPLMLRVIDWQLRMPDRAAYESRVRQQVTKHIRPTDPSKSKIISRTLKICKDFNDWSIKSCHCRSPQLTYPFVGRLT